MIDENLPHQPGDDAHEMRAAAPVDPLDAAQPQVGFVHQRGRLQCMVAAFGRQLAIGDGAQLRINEVDHPIARGQVALPPVGEQLCESGGHAGESSSAGTRRRWE